MRKTAIAAVSAIVLAGCGIRRPALIDPALSTLVPGDATAVVGVRAEALRATPFYRKWAASRSFGAPGVDLKNKAWQILVATDGKHTALLARGKFADEGAEPATPAGMTRTQYKGYTLFTGPAEGLAFLNPSTIVAGPADSVRFVLDQRGHGDGPPAALRRQMQAAAARGEVWLAAAGDLGGLAAGAPQTGNLASFAKLLAPVDTLIAAADFKNGVKVSAEAVCRTEEDAKALENALGALLALGRIGIRDQELLHAYEAIKAERQQKTIVLNAALAEEAIDKLLGGISARARGN
jgi:hypothetical protein